MTDFNVRNANLRALNSMTQYPSIPTYHALDPKTGNLCGGTITFRKTVIGTEKVDGTNARIVLLPDKTYLIGSRNDLLYARGDLLANPAQGIVDAVRWVTEDLADYAPDSSVTVFFGEVYGHKIGQAAKQYTTSGVVGFRLFDVAQINNYAEVLSWPLEKIAAWRDGGGQPYIAEPGLQALAREFRLDLTPRLFEVEPTALPTDLEKTRAFLAEYLPQTLVALDAATFGLAEGIVLRTEDRSTIAKARFQDYDRTLRRRNR